MAVWPARGPKVIKGHRPYLDMIMTSTYETLPSRVLSDDPRQPDEQQLGSREKFAPTKTPAGVNQARCRHTAPVPAGSIQT